MLFGSANREPIRMHERTKKAVDTITKKLAQAQSKPKDESKIAAVDKAIQKLREERKLGPEQRGRKATL